MFTTTTNNFCKHKEQWLVMWLFTNSLKISFVAGSESSATNYLDIDGVTYNTWNEMKVVAIGDLIRLHINDGVKGTLNNANIHYCMIIWIVPTLHVDV